VTVLFVIPCGDYLPSGTVRVRQFLPFLDRLGIRHRILSYFSPTVDRFDARVRAGGTPPIVQRLLLAGAAAARSIYSWGTRARIFWLAPRTDLVFFQGVLPPIWYLRALVRRNPHTVLDLDDALFLVNPARAAAVLPMMWRVIAGSHFIFDYVAPLNPRVVLVPSAVPLERYDPVDDSSTGRERLDPPSIRLGWLGGPATVKYLKQLVTPLRQLAAEGHRLELLVDGVGQNAAAIPAFAGVAVTSTPTYGEHDIPRLVSGYDIGLMPLDDGPWERAKCAMKALIYMAAAKPAVCSRVGENSYVIDDGVNGSLTSSEADWVMKLRDLIVSPQLRAEMGRRGRQTVEQRYSTGVSFALLNEHVFSQIGKRRR
jgi:glycosyltransferase involved in cell wall biosynthesis